MEERRVVVVGPTTCWLLVVGCWLLAVACFCLLLLPSLFSCTSRNYARLCVLSFQNSRWESECYSKPVLRKQTFSSCSLSAWTRGRTREEVEVEDKVLQPRLQLKFRILAVICIAILNCPTQLQRGPAIDNALRGWEQYLLLNGRREWTLCPGLIFKCSAISFWFNRVCIYPIGLVSLSM